MCHAERLAGAGRRVWLLLRPPPETAPRDEQRRDPEEYAKCNRRISGIRPVVDGHLLSGRLPVDTLDEDSKIGRAEKGRGVSEGADLLR